MSDNLMIAAMVLKFIGPDSRSDSELKVFLQLNKRWKSALTK